MISALLPGRARWSTARRQLVWLVTGLIIGFLVPYVFADLMGLPRDLYYGIYIAVVAAFFGAWTRATGHPIGPMLRRRWRLMMVLSLIVTALLALVVIRTDDSSPRPDGLELAAALLWRGVLYGLADGLLLSAFPILVVFAAAADSKLRARWTGTAAVGVAAMAASLVMTAVYHLGYADFRSDKLGKPVTGDVLWSVPTLVTLNPAGAPIVHAGMHVTAVLHSYETAVFLPPHG